ncbi:4Fe-4S dicluster domain-containing protein [Winogradskyella maritima]|uniref:4Fe-4S binding protein n=1 Tax=Winogradskyella maritima TaxID=1517766 RepID=A0ABV8AJT5_9FLAO|nr:4Fe-4S dicluster domain-containing protein [Winogradskyella maritima]
MALENNMALTGQPPKSLNTKQKIGVVIGMVGLLILLLATFNVELFSNGLVLTIALSALMIGIIVFSKGAYDHKLEGIKNDGVWFKSISSRGVLGWVAGVALTGFYIILYFYADLLGLGQGVDGANTGLIRLFDPLSYLLSGNPASQWFVYGVLYTIAILGFGIKFLMKYKHNKYEQLRTVSVMFFQTAFAFLIPELMARLNSDTFSLPYNDLKNMWPLNYYAFDQWRVDQFINAETIGIFFLVLSVAMVFLVSPWLTYKYGKRWYCSWVCGCGGLAETAGDSFRHLSSKKLSAWKIERWLIHTVLVFSVIMTTAVIHSYLGTDTSKYWLTKSNFLISVGTFLTGIFALTMIYKRQELGKHARYGAIGFLIVIASLFVMHYTGTTERIFFFKAGAMRSAYGLYIGSIFSGVVGTGFYPILGNRVWCRFGCPMAAILGFQQRMFSKFRITTNGGQCISCGNCSTYCEMGIDVRAYAQKGENIVRSSCVGCGVCSAVCPRGVLKLENDSLKGRINPNDILLGNDVDLMTLVNQK